MFDNSSKPKVKRDLSKARDIRQRSDSRDNDSMNQFFKELGIEDKTQEKLNKASGTFMPKRNKNQGLKN